MRKQAEFLSKKATLKDKSETASIDKPLPIQRKGNRRNIAPEMTAELNFSRK